MIKRAFKAKKAGFLISALAVILPFVATSIAVAQDDVKDVSSQNWRVLNPENAIVIDTTKGRIIVELFPQGAPNHIERVKQLTRQHFYDGLIFHRVIDGFMDQTGDPKGDGSGGSSLPDLKPEFTFRRGSGDEFVSLGEFNGRNLGFINSMPVVSQTDAIMNMTTDGKVSAYGTHCQSVASMARSDAEDSANSQFFLMRDTKNMLDTKYTAWGRVVIGEEVVRAIKTGEPVVNPDKMLKVQVLADMPQSEQPKIYVEKTDGPLFQAQLAKILKARGPDFSICDISPEAKIAQ